MKNKEPIEDELITREQLGEELSHHRYGCVIT